MAIQGDGGQILELGQLVFLGLELGLEFFELGQLLGARIDDDLVVDRIQQQQIAIVDTASDVVGAHDGRQLQGAGHDGGVRGTATDVGDETQHVFQVDLSGFGRSQVVGDQDDFFVYGAQVDHCDAQRVLHQTGADITKIGGALPQIGIIQVGHHLGVLLDDLIDGLVSGGLVVLDEGSDIPFQLLIFEQHDVAFEDGLFFFTEGATGHLFDGFQLSG